MSSSGTLAKGAYTRRAVALAESACSTVMGFICLKRLSENPGMIHFTPGVKMERGEDSLGQCYRTVEEVLIKNSSDIIIVGRDITHAKEPKSRALLYRERGWAAYAETIS